MSLSSRFLWSRITIARLKFRGKNFLFHATFWNISISLSIVTSWASLVSARMTVSGTLNKEIYYMNSDLYLFLYFNVNMKTYTTDLNDTRFTFSKNLLKYNWFFRELSFVHHWTRIRFLETNISLSSYSLRKKEIFI